MLITNNWKELEHKVSDGNIDSNDANLGLEGVEMVGEGIEMVDI